MKMSSLSCSWRPSGFSVVGSGSRTWILSMLTAVLRGSSRKDWREGKVYWFQGKWFLIILIDYQWKLKKRIKPNPSLLLKISSITAIALSPRSPTRPLPWFSLYPSSHPVSIPLFFHFWVKIIPSAQSGLIIKKIQTELPLPDLPWNRASHGFYNWKKSNGGLPWVLYFVKAV